MKDQSAIRALPAVAQLLEALAPKALLAPDELLGHIHTLEARLKELRGRVDGLAKTSARVAKRLAALEHRVGSTSAMTNQ